jgi:hypothetical protein
MESVGLLKFGEEKYYYTPLPQNVSCYIDQFVSEKTIIFIPAHYECIVLNVYVVI